MENFKIELNKQETLSIITALVRESSFQKSQASKYGDECSLRNFRAYHKRRYQRADALASRFLNLPGLADTFADERIDAMGREPEFVLSVWQMSFPGCRKDEGADSQNVSKTNVFNGEDVKNEQ